MEVSAHRLSLLLRSPDKVIGPLDDCFEQIFLRHKRGKELGHGKPE